VNDDDAPSPEEIRALRGTLSRARFAELLGVAPHTVYRWELEPGAAQARRPSGASLEALHRFSVRRAQAIEEPPASALTDAIDALHRCRWERAERELLALLSGGHLGPAEQTLALAASAQLQLWSRNDARAALAILGPALALDTRSVASRLALDVAAAFVFGAPDGRVFDAGRAANHVRLVDEASAMPPAPDALVAARIAELGAAMYLGDPAVMTRAMTRAANALDTATLPVHALIAAELRGHQALVEGRPALALHRFEEAARQAELAGWPLAQARALAFAALQRLVALEAPDAALEQARRADAIAAQHGVQRGFHSMIAAHVASEALLRLGKLAAAEEALAAGTAVADELAWPLIHLVSPLVRLASYRQRAEPLHALLARMAGTPASWSRPIEGYELFARAALEDLAGNPAAAADLYARAISGTGHGFPYLLREATIARAASLIAAGHPAASVVLEDSERILDRYPSAWASAVVRRLRGIALLGHERTAEARQLLESSASTFARSGDQPQAALSRYALACAAISDRVQGGEELLAQARAELAGLGVAIPRHPDPDVLRVRPPRVTVPVVTADATVWIERLCLRGAPPALVRSELEVVLSSALGCTVRVVAASEPAVLELPDGAGGTLRLGSDVALDSARSALARALGAIAALSLENAALRGLGSVAEPPAPGPGFIAASPALRRLYGEAARVAASRSTVLVGGESGSGKEVIAKLLHQLSPRRAKPFVAVNCAAVPRELFEGQLFGYRKGAFTGADADHAGLVRDADGGTLFLDEIGELPAEVQPKLLRFLDLGEVQPVGGGPVTADVRLVAATHRNLEELAAIGGFRQDLFYRLQVVVLRVPPLRERPEDIVALARHFVARLAPDGADPPVLGPDAIATLLAHDWPGNVRELRNVIERSLAFGVPHVIGRDHLRVAP
jgi:hypothetical protein